MISIKINWFNAILIAFIAILLTGSALPKVQADTTTPIRRTINVTGEAQVNVPHDEVIMTLGLETQDKNFENAKHQNDEQLTQFLALVKAYNIPADQVRADFIGINPYYPYQQNNTFVVRKTVVVTLKDISKFEDFLTIAVNSGVSSVQSIRFETTELRKYKDQARAMAMQAAKEKADAMAGQLGEKVGRPASINEDQVGWYSYYDNYNWWGQQYGNQQANAVQNVAQAQGNGSSNSNDGTAGPGDISVTAHVSVVFDLQN
jgi:uncharacterized protein YggE